MIHRIPSGTRDVLPDEMRELRAITDALRSVFELHGYGVLDVASAVANAQTPVATVAAVPAGRMAPPAAGSSPS